jgi:hypothetical protein
MSPPLTVLCWLWSQPGAPGTYTARHVNVWAGMVRRNLTIPHRIACVTRDPAGIEPGVDIITPPGDFEDICIPTWGPARPQCLRRLSMFRPDAAAIFGPRFVCMDVDCVVTGPLDSLFDRPETAVFYASPPSSGGALNPRPYNGSMLMLTAGARPQVYDQFTPERAAAAGRRFVGSDQAWISEVLGPNEPTWSEADGVVWWGRWQGGIRGCLVFFPGRPKPWSLIDSEGWIRRAYTRGRGGRCLVLGYAPTVWSEATAALDAGRFDAVIASPEAAEHWPGPIEDVARSDAHALRLADEHGFDEVVFCGRSERHAA